MPRICHESVGAELPAASEEVVRPNHPRGGAVHVVVMKFIGKLLIALAVIGGACMWVTYNGHWNAVVSFTAAVFGQEAADGVDRFGELSDDVGGDVVDYGTRLAEQIKNGETPTPDWASVDEALGGLSKPTAERRPGYERTAFGKGWLDTDQNGCDTRNDILARDLTAKVIDANGCTVLSGTLADPYTATTIQFTRGAATSSKVQIDHIVPLSLAWNEGAWRWTSGQREAFANDPMNLLAVDGPTNSGKSDKSISEWLPPSGASHCTYVALYVAVHDKYDLAMSDADNSAADKLVTACG